MWVPTSIHKTKKKHLKKLIFVMTNAQLFSTLNISFYCIGVKNEIKKVLAKKSYHIVFCFLVRCSIIKLKILQLEYSSN